MDSIRTKLLRVDSQKFILHKRSDYVPLSAQKTLSALCSVFHGKEIPHDWDWSWNTNNGEFRGKMPRRLRKLCGVELLAQPIENILQKTREDMPSPEMYVIDVTFNIDWRDGAFGDGGSCYWNNNSQRIKYMERYGYGAVRRYRLPSGLRADSPDAERRVMETIDSLLGYGRAWIAPDLPEEGALCIYNTYPSGFYNREFADIFAQLLPKMINEPEKVFSHCRCSFDIMSGSIMYLNGDGELICEDNKISDWEGRHDTKSVRVDLRGVDHSNVFK